jgi:phosphonate transport system substrate-binding protein
MSSWIVPAESVGRRLMLRGLAALPAAACCRPVAADSGPYLFAPVNQFGVALTASYWNPILTWVSAHSGLALRLKISRTSAETIQSVVAGEVQFSFNNHLFTPERERLGWKVLARRDTPPVRGVIAVLESSPIRSLEQLAGAEVGFPGAEATVAYRVTNAQLAAHRIEVKPVFGGNHDGAFAQLAAGRVKAVGANLQLIDAWSRRENQPIRILWQSEPFNELALMSSPKVPERDANAFASALIGMSDAPEGLLILRQVSERVGLKQATGFVRATEADYDSYRRFFRAHPER